MSATNEHIEKLMELRTVIVDRRRQCASEIGSEDSRINAVIHCQTVLKAIDEAIADERRLAPRPGAHASWYVGR